MASKRSHTQFLLPSLPQFGFFFLFSRESFPQGALLISLPSPPPLPPTVKGDSIFNYSFRISSSVLKGLQMFPLIEKEKNKIF